ncbi:unnamed protein product [Gongylonema pulchrum]|uniref:Uncharacterized protein n=1 Tax=Gongylonema pulchrum TaxID=637853 RepID=A0A183DCS4_9BILA|nr:unnamed protein product [Gongylonema pulchrum]
MFRSVQLVYVNHILPSVALEKLPFEPHFPFDSYNLKRSLSFISTLTKQFSPLAEDKNVLKCELLWKRANQEVDIQKVEETIGSWEFLQDIRRDQNEKIANILFTAADKDLIMVHTFIYILLILDSSFLTSMQFYPFIRSFLKLLENYIL